MIKRRIEKNTAKIYALVTIIVLFQENMIYLTNRNTIFALSFIGAILLFVICLNENKEQFAYKKVIMFLVAVLLYGVVLAYFRYGQNLFLGLYGNHYIFIYAWYFYLGGIAKKSRKNQLIMRDAIISWGTFLCLIVNIQGFFANRVHILQLGYSERNGIRIGGCNIAITAFILALACELERHSLKRCISVAIVAFYLVVFNQSRSVLIILVISIVLVLWRKLNNQQFKVSKATPVVAILALSVLAFRADIVISAIQSVVHEVTNISGTGGVRVQEIIYYFELLKESHFLGIGLLAAQFHLTDVVYATKNYLFMEDIGMLSFVFKTGVLGLIASLLFVRRFVIEAKRVKIPWKKYTYVLMGTQILFGFITFGIFDNKYFLVYELLLLSILETSQDFDNSEKDCKDDNTKNV